MGDVPAADLTRQPDEVALMFDGVAERYDITNDILALGQTRLWRRAVLNSVRPEAGEVVLDLAAGTGTSSMPFRARGAYVVPCDFSLGMLTVGRHRSPELPFVAGDALRLPFADGTFDAATISFGLRNTADPHAALSEMLRVLRPGGRLVVCEFSHPVMDALRTVYTEYLMRALPAVAQRFATNAEAYVYLAESIRAWPNQPELARWIQQAGFAGVAWLDLTGGIVAIHRAFRPIN